MPSYWSSKQERQYKHIVKSCKRSGRYGVKRCKSIAAATVNKHGGLGDFFDSKVTPVIVTGGILTLVTALRVATAKAWQF